jgi:hypothetical protein
MLIWLGEDARSSDALKYRLGTLVHVRNFVKLICRFRTIRMLTSRWVQFVSDRNPLPLSSVPRLRPEILGVHLITANFHQLPSSNKPTVKTRQLRNARPGSITEMLT